jgi:ferredoxin
MTGRLKVDPIACTGQGMCAELFPERIRLDDWGYPIVDPTPIPPGPEGRAQRAVKACPTLALRLAAERLPTERPGAISPAVGPALYVFARSPGRTHRVPLLGTERVR